VGLVLGQHIFGLIFSARLLYSSAGRFAYFLLIKQKKVRMINGN
jgi:hypothetical protein